MITAVVDTPGKSVTYYIDGSVNRTVTYTNALPALTLDNLLLGSWYVNSAYRSYNSDIDEAGIWNRALTASEISQLYNSGAGLQHPFPTQSSYQNTQDLSYVYDADGNITTRTDNSTSGAGQVVNYSYDGLNRLTSASTTGATSTAPAYNTTFTYDALGNLLTGPGGAYSYAGGSGANPHAVTQTQLTLGATAPTIRYDNSTLAGNGVNASSLTFAHTTDAATSTNTVIVVGVQEATTGSCTSDKVTSVTYNGTGLTDMGYFTSASSSGTALKTYYGYAPAQGVHNVVVSASASCIRYVVATTYSGVKQSGMPDASGTGNPLADSGAVTTLSASTNLSYNAWPVLIGVPSVSNTATGGTNTFVRNQQQGNLIYADSDSPQQGTAVLSLSTATSTHWSANYFAISPLVSNPGTTYTTNYSYDANGNLTGTTQGATSTTYTWDYGNRMVSSAGTGLPSLSYTYDPSGARLSQTGATSTTIYPSRSYSLTYSGSNATSTEYVYAGDVLIATIDQAYTNGTAVGSSTVRFVHVDNLGSTQVTTDMNGNLVQSMAYAPYGAVIAQSSANANTNLRVGYIDRFLDSSGLNYLQARYYDSARGQFISQDPVFWSANQNLADPQSLNSYSYANDNPITRKDPTGEAASLSGILNSIVATLNAISNTLSNMNTVSYSRGSSGAAPSSPTNSGSGRQSPAVAKPNDDYYNGVYSAAEKRFIGKPYKEAYTSTGPDYYDCSGAVVAGIRDVANPNFGRHTADDLYHNYTTPLPGPGGSGTLIFYDNKTQEGSHIDHVSTYIGNGQIIDPNGAQGYVARNPATYESNYTANQGGSVHYAQINWSTVMSDH